MAHKHRWRGFWVPGRQLMHAASFSVKSWIIALAFTAPIVLLSVYSAIDFSDERNFTRREVDGVTLLEAFWPLNDALLLTRNATRAGASGFDVSSEIERGRKRIDALFLALAPIFERAEASAVLGPPFSELQKKWDATQQATSPLEATGKSTIYAPLSTASINLQQQIADESGIILDPDIDTLYLGLMATQVLPNLLENLGQLRAWSTYLTAKSASISFGELNQAHQRYAVWDAEVQTQIGLYRQYAAKVGGYNPGTRQQLNVQFLERAEGFRQAAYQAVMNENSPHPEQLWAEGSKVFDETSASYGVVLPLLRKLLESRLHAQQSKFLTLTLFAGLLLLLATYLFGSFFRGMVHDMAQQNKDEAALRLAKQEAEHAAIVKSQFLANMSHEIRTPMNAVLGMLKLLQGTDLTPRQFDYVGKSESAAKSLLGLLNDILDFSKIDAGKMELDLEPFRLDRLMRDLSVILSVNVGAKPLEVLFDIDPATPNVVVGDALRLQQVLINLSSNAIKFTQSGEVVLQVKVVRKSQNSSTLHFSVRDTGIGIAADKQEHIFSGFSQAETSTTRRFGGTGLGLSISKRLVGLMGGNLELTSVLGQGSNFHFTVTMQTKELEDDLSAQAALPVAKNLHVLVVDDHAVARELLAGMARSWGWQVDVAADGAQAIALVEARIDAGQPAYHAIFMDWEMPGLDGWDTIARLRQLGGTTLAPITVMVTAHSRQALSSRSTDEQAQLSAFLVKPVTASMLYDAVAEAMAGHTQVRPRMRSPVASEGRLRGMRLLVVEDNLINQQVARELLISEGADVAIADNGLLGVTAVAQASVPFTAVLMDLQMPVMDGFAATRAIRNELHQKSLPIIAMTANAMASDREECLAAGMDDHVGKPFDLSHLVSVLLKHAGLDAVGSPAQQNEIPPVDVQSSVISPETNNEVPTMNPTVIDSQQALNRIGGMRSLYLGLLREFLSDLKTVVPEYHRMLSASLFHDAARHMHTLKGTAATLGATELSALAFELEKKCKSPVEGPVEYYQPADLQALVASTRVAVEQVIIEFDKPPPVKVPTSDVSKLADNV
jgi:signal transduction histidine kinase/CheY-like chemotaxis protein